MLLSFADVKAALARTRWIAPSSSPSPSPSTPVPLHRPTIPVAQRTIVIDPGHGGIDPGAIGRTGTYEKHVVLSVADNFAEELGRLTGARVKLTRQTDIFLPLEERVAIAQGVKADLFVSVHADAAPEQSARGLSVYTLSEVASDRLSAALAHRENNVDALYGVNLQHVDQTVAKILFDLARRSTLNQSLALQHELVADLRSQTRLLDNPARSANFAVLRSPSVPAVLIETGFLSNGQDEALLCMPRYQRHMGLLLAHAVSDSINSALSA
mgnify:FL=1